MPLQEWFNSIKDGPFLPLPAKVLNISDAHAAAGNDHDPLKASGMESNIVDCLDYHFDRGYTLFGSEFWDAWRGRIAKAIFEAHQPLVLSVNHYRDAGQLHMVISNHNLDVFSYPEYLIFKGFGKQIFLDHGHKFDNPWNDKLWQLGRAAVRAADELGIDPETGKNHVSPTSPHPSNPERHLAVIKMRDELARTNPDWIFLYGHTHCFRNTTTHPEQETEVLRDPNNPRMGTETVKVGCPPNSFNSGCLHSKIEGYLIEEGNIIPL